MAEAGDATVPMHHSPLALPPLGGSIRVNTHDGPMLQNPCRGCLSIDPYRDVEIALAHDVMGR